MLVTRLDGRRGDNIFEFDMDDSSVLGGIIG
jgi:hypothetical protein